MLDSFDKRSHDTFKIFIVHIINTIKRIYKLLIRVTVLCSFLLLYYFNATYTLLIKIHVSLPFLKCQVVQITDP